MLYPKGKTKRAIVLYQQVCSFYKMKETDDLLSFIFVYGHHTLYSVDTTGQFKSHQSLFGSILFQITFHMNRPKTYLNQSMNDFPPQIYPADTVQFHSKTLIIIVVISNNKSF